ncbi:hypothetical protein LMG27198_40910 [Methylocystis echinoides]|uniref:Uncharacterized protein n=2 Tax=Methylocystis echinoides TaxID=29468 RepID=A0A9W6GY41_9HYPH|nr:hypothetical protein LMG27198_40910 [Methylocystis echinoides]
MLVLAAIAYQQPVTRAELSRLAGQRTTLDILNPQQKLLNARIGLIIAQRERVVLSYAVVAAI